MAHYYFGQLPNLLGGYDGWAKFQGGGIVRKEMPWAPIVVGLGPSAGLAMGSVATLATVRNTDHPENIVSIGDRGTIAGILDTGGGPPGSDPAVELSLLTDRERIAVWKYRSAIAVERGRAGYGRYWPLDGFGDPIAPDAFVVALLDPPERGLAGAPEAYRAWVAREDGTFAFQSVGVDGTPAGRFYTFELPAPTGPSAPPTVGAVGPGGTIAAGYYLWCYTWVTDGVESLPSMCSVETHLLDSSQAPLSGILPGPAGTTERRIYRGGLSMVVHDIGGYRDETFMERPRFDQCVRVGTITDNTTTTFTDDTGTSTTSPEAAAAAWKSYTDLLGGPGGRITRYTGYVLARYFGEVGR